MQKTDGFLIGNGRCYLVEGSAFELDRRAKTCDRQETPIPYHSIVCLNGPVYGFNHFAYGFTVTLEYTVDGKRCSRGFSSGMEQSIRYNADGIQNELTDDQGTILIEDTVAPDQDVIVRRIEVQNREKVRLSNPKLLIRYQYDRRNLTYCDFDGSALPMPQSVKGPLRYEDHVLCGESHITFRIPAHKPMYDDWACGYGKQLDYAFMRERFLTVTSRPAAQNVTDTGFEIPLDESLTAQLFFGFGFTREESLPVLPLKFAKPAAAAKVPVIESDCARIPELFRRIEGLIRANTAECGGVLAQPVMYPMSYNRDIYGSYLFYAAMGDLSMMKKILWFFHICQTTYDLQNAYDVESFGYQPDSTFHPVPSRHKNAEVPSYFLLMARDYYRLSGDLALMKKLYPHLCHNLESQKLTIHFTIGTEGDESYTNFPESVPKYAEEMTDSCFLYTVACDFLGEIAGKLGYEADAQTYTHRAKCCRDAVEHRMFLPEQGHYLFSRREREVDTRPALDLLCHPLFFRYANPHHANSLRSFRAVLEQLVNPHLQIVPGFNKCAGGDIGYLLYNAAAFQLPAADQFFADYQKFVSSSGAFSEYYFAKDGEYCRQGGNLRPWESGINGYSLFSYLFGIDADLPNRTLRLAPHLPPDVRQLSIREYPIGGETLSLSLRREGDAEMVEVSGNLPTFAVTFVTGSTWEQTVSITVNGQPVSPAVFDYQTLSREYTVPLTLTGKKTVLCIRKTTPDPNQVSSEIAKSGIPG